jgi:hypothetical protein
LDSPFPDPEARQFNFFILLAYQPGRIELIFDGTDLSEVDAPTVEIIQSLGNEIYEQLKRGEAITVTMRCCGKINFLFVSH